MLMFCLCFSFNANFVVPSSFSTSSVFVPPCTTFFISHYKEANDRNSAFLLLLGTRPKLMMCMQLSLSGQLLLTSLL